MGTEAEYPGCPDPWLFSVCKVSEGKPDNFHPKEAAIKTISLSYQGNCNVSYWLRFPGVQPFLFIVGPLEETSVGEE